MLWHRVVTSFVLLGLILGAVFGLSPLLFSGFIALVLGIAVWEWTALTGISSMVFRLIYLAGMLALMLAVNHLSMSLEIQLWLGIICWLLAFLLICLYPSGTSYWSNKFVLAFTGVPLFIPGWLAFNYFRAQDFYTFHLLLLFFLVAAADIGAYFAGRSFGRHKLAVKVSPNKTWEGFFGGMLACVLLLVITVLIFSDQIVDMNTGLWLKLIVTAVLVAAFSVIGDLFESMVKRFQDVKDSGTILPGHGGILDRIDGLTAAAPVYALLLIYIGQDFL